VIALVVALTIIVGLLVFMWISIGREPGPSAADVAIAYERAYDDHDFDLLYELSGEEMRDGMRRERFVRAKRAALGARAPGKHEQATISVDTTVAGHQTALVVTSVTAGAHHVRNNVLLEKGSNGWTVVKYTLRPDTADDSAATGGERSAESTHDG
jgi:hypothetical protein